MTSETWPTADERLERHYHRLLLAYSGRYRRRHGTEIVTTLLEMSEPGRSRPSAADARHLLASGLRQRFRLPSGSPFALVAAVLMTITLGTLGAAAGSWAGERTFAGLPSDAAVQAITSSAVADPADVGWGHQGRWNQPGNAAFVEVIAFPRAQDPGPIPTWTVEQARDGLTAAGWKITDFAVRPMSAPLEPDVSILGNITIGDDPEKSPGTLPNENLRRYAVLTAERDGLILHGTVTDAIGGHITNPDDQVITGGINAHLYAERTAAYLPLIAAGALLGGIAGWLLTAATAYRIRGAARPRRRATIEFTRVALAAATVPVFAIIRNTTLLGANLNDHQPVHTLWSVLRPGWWWIGEPNAWLIPRCALIAAAAGLLALITAWARIPGRPRPDEAMRQSSTA